MIYLMIGGVIMNIEFQEVIDEAKKLDLKTLKENLSKLEILINKIEKILGEEE